MGLRTPLTVSPYLYMGDSTGRPLDFGMVYFGEPDKDPEFYPIPIFYDEAMTVAASQPVRTKGGFMNAFGNMVEIYASEVVYSVKVLDQYGRLILSKARMHRNNVADSLQDEIVRAIEAEQQITENLLQESERAKNEEQNLATSIADETERATAAETALSTTINSIGGGKRAYTTYAAMIADKVNITPNSSIDVTNDADALKNGTYAFDGTTFTKSAYDVQSLVLNKVENPFETYAKMVENVTLQNGAHAFVFDDTDDKNGHYQKRGGAWVKVKYDPLSQSKNYVDSKATIEYFNISAATDLNTIKEAGTYVVSASSLVTTSLNYPKPSIIGYLVVTTAKNTSAVHQMYHAVNGITSQRFFNSTTWTAWIDTTNNINVFAIKNESLTYIDKLQPVDNLNDFKNIGLWSASSLPTDWSASNYPARQVGVLQVYKLPVSSQVFQLYITSNNMYLRYSDSSNIWSAWVAFNKPEAALSGYDVKGIIAEQNLNDLKGLGVYLKNSRSTGSPDLNYPTLTMGVLKVYKGTMTSLIIQEYVSINGSVYIRYWNNISWSEWAVNKATSVVPQPSGGGSDLLSFVKTTDKLDFVNKSGNGNNAIKTTLKRNTNPLIQQDVWGIGSCEEIDASGVVVKPITSSGVWETAIRATENKGDHSGGGHGDEVLQSAYFLIDGIYYSQDFVLSGTAKEIKFYQKSTLYIEDTTDILCYKEIVWTFDNKGSRLKQKLTFPTAKSLETSWIAMLPVLRKTNQDNTGDRVTDTEIRSQDGVVIDASEPTFPRRNLDIKSGDSISLSSAVSGIGAELLVNNIEASANPQAFVQNTAPYNKIYVNGATIGSDYTTSAGEIWNIDATFKVTTRN